MNDILQVLNILILALIYGQMIKISAAQQNPYSQFMPPLSSHPTPPTQEKTEEQKELQSRSYFTDEDQYYLEQMERTMEDERKRLYKQFEKDRNGEAHGQI